MLRRTRMFFCWTQLLLLFLFMSIPNIRAEELCPPKENVHPCQSLSCKKLNGTVSLKLLCVDIPSSFKFSKMFEILGNEVKVESLRIIRSQVTNFTRDMFPHQALRDISISKTNITSLSEDTFKNLPLEYLSLIHCNLTHRDNSIKAIRHILKLKSLYLTENHFKMVKHSWFEEPGGSIKLPGTLISLSLKQNEISLIGDEAFHSLKKLEYLDLSENNIQYLKRNFFPDDLDSLSLGYNKIEVLPEDLFEGMEHLRYLRLEHNSITHLEENVFKDLFSESHLRIVDLRGNPVNCSCYLNWLPYNGNKPGRFYGECDSPEALRKRALAGITMADIKCSQVSFGNEANNQQETMTPVRTIRNDQKLC